MAAACGQQGSLATRVVCIQKAAMAEATILSLLQELFPTLDSALLTDIVAGYFAKFFGLVPLQRPQSLSFLMAACSPTSAGAECSVESLVEELLSMQHQRQCIKEEEAPLPTGVCSATRPSVCVDGEPATSFHSGGSSRAPVRSAHTTNVPRPSSTLALMRLASLCADLPFASPHTA